MQIKKTDEQDIKELYQTILKLKTQEDCEMLFSDLCTKMEIIKMAQRIKAAKLLMDGKTYNQVIEKTDISSATLSRVSRCIQYGEGGYTKFLKEK